MKKYDYNAQVAEDLKNNLEDWFDNHDIDGYCYFDDLVNDIQDYFFNEDCVTGNASGSYTYNTWAAEENLCHNTGLLVEVLDKFGMDYADYFRKGAEACDVAIRCYVLGQVAYDVVRSYVDEHYPYFEG